MPVAQVPDITLTLSPVLLADILSAIEIGRKHVKDAAKPRLSQFHTYAQIRPVSPRMTFTFTPTLLRDIIECIKVAVSRDDLEKKNRDRLHEWKDTVEKLVPEPPKLKQARLKIP
jgi:hypothetical protein